MNISNLFNSFNCLRRFEKIPLGSLTLIELGAAPNRTGMSALSTRGSNMFKSSSSVAPMCIRLSYKTEDSDNEFYHMFRSANLRFFNNVAVVIRTKEEMLGMHCLLPVFNY